MPNAEIRRDRYGKPLVIPPDGGKPVAYFRASSFGDVLDDRSALAAWRERNIVGGLAQRPDLIARATAAVALYDRRALTAVVREALDHAGTGRSASLGTGLHALAEAVDRGLDPYIPPEHAADIAAYVAATERFENVQIEQFVVNDEVQAAGTPDRVIYHGEPLRFDGLTLPPASRIADIKTGSSALYLHQHAPQLAIYAHALAYDVETGARSTLDVDRSWGLIYHLPAGTGRCDVYAIDLEHGWDAAHLARRIRTYRQGRATVVAAA